MAMSRTSSNDKDSVDKNDTKDTKVEKDRKTRAPVTWSKDSKVFYVIAARWSRTSRTCF